MVGTTDDPIDSLEWHKKIKEDPTIKVVVAPSFRPDKVLNIRKEGFADYIHKLEEVVGRKLPAQIALSVHWKNAWSSSSRWAAALLTTVWTTSPLPKRTLRRQLLPSRRPWPVRP